MGDESKGKFDWVPLTPPKSVPARYEFNSKSKLMVCEFGDNIQKFDGGFMVSENPVSSSSNGKPEGTMVLKSDKRTPEETIEAEASLFSETPQRMNLHKRPTTKMPSTPNSSKCPKLEINNVTVTGTTSVQPSKDKYDGREEVVDSNENKCRRKLDFENHAVKFSKVCDEIGGNQSDLNSVGRFSRVYTRIFKPNECLKNSRKIGPNFPSIFKKARMGRRRATAFEKFNEFMEFVKLENTQKHTRTQEHIRYYSKATRRKRSDRFSRKMDLSFLSSFIKDLRHLQFSEIFLWIASSIRTKLAARLEVNVVYCDENIQHSSEKKSAELHTSSPNFEDHTCRIELDCSKDFDDHTDGIELESPKDFDDYTDGVELELAVHSTNIKRSDDEEENNGGENVNINRSDDEEENDEGDNVSASQDCDDYDLYTKALVDFSSQMMKGLHIHDVFQNKNDDASKQLVAQNVSNQLFVQNKNDAVIAFKAKFGTPNKHQPLVKVDNTTKYQLVQSDTPKRCQRRPKFEEAKYYEANDTVIVFKEKIDTPNKHQALVTVDNAAKYQLACKKNFDTPKQRQPRPKFDKAKYYEVQLDKCICAMHVIQVELSLDKQFLSWQGSMVDLVVCGFLIQNFRDCLPSEAFNNLVSRFPAGSDATVDSASNDIKLLKKVEELCDEVDPEQLSMVEKYDPKDGNINLLQSESRSVGKIEDKQDTRHWDKLRVKYSTPENRTDYNRNSIDWDAVRQASHHTLTVVILKKSTNYLLAGRIKDLLERIDRDHGCINLEWLRDVPPHKSKEYMLSISGLDLKSVEFLSLLLSLQHQD